MLVFIAEEQNLPEVTLGMSFDFGHAIDDGTFEVELHHDAEGLGEAGVEANWEIQRANLCSVYQPRERRKRLPAVGPDVFLGVVDFLGRTETPLHLRVVVEEGRNTEMPSTMDVRSFG